MRFFNVILGFRVHGLLVQPEIKHIPALDRADASRKALGTSVASSARAQGAEVEVVCIRESAR